MASHIPSHPVSRRTLLRGGAFALLAAAAGGALSACGTAVPGQPTTPGGTQPVGPGTDGVVVAAAGQDLTGRGSRTTPADPAAHRHVLVMRTLSKFGLAGVRIGYLMGEAALVAEIDKLRPPYNVSVLNAECALFALEHADVFAAQAADIRAQRAQLLAALAALPGVTPYPSQANMILARVPDAARAFAGMRARGVLIKNVSTMHPLLANCVRLTVGTADENAQMLAALQASL